MKNTLQIQVSPYISSTKKLLKNWIANELDIPLRNIKHVYTLKRSIDARQKIKNSIDEKLKKKEINFRSSKSYSTPKRLVFFIEGLPEKIEQKKKIIKGTKVDAPKIALDGGSNGFSKITKVIDKASILIKKNGKFILEIGCYQRNEIVNKLKNKNFYINKIIKDYGKKDRCIISTKI